MACEGARVVGCQKSFHFILFPSSPPFSFESRVYDMHWQWKSPHVTHPSNNACWNDWTLRVKMGSPCYQINNAFQTLTCIQITWDLGRMQVLIQQVWGRGGLGFFISHKLPDDTDAARPKPALGVAGDWRYMLPLLALLGFRSRQVWLMTVSHIMQILLIIKWV